MVITLTAIQHKELQDLVLALINVKNSTGRNSGEITADSTKVEYNSSEVKFTISD